MKQLTYTVFFTIDFYIKQFPDYYRIYTRI